jgi:tRNA isopentenyl-2-thiomethyl-A-37 hydroxylase MiaE
MVICVERASKFDKAVLLLDVNEEEQAIGATHVKFITKYPTNIPTDCIKVTTLN